MKALKPVLLWGGLLAALIVGFTLVSADRSDTDLRATMRADDVTKTRGAVVEVMKDEFKAGLVGERTDNSTPSSELRFRVPAWSADAVSKKLDELTHSEVVEMSIDLDVLADEADDNRVGRLKTLNECLAETQAFLQTGSADAAASRLAECQTTAGDVVHDTERIAQLAGDALLVVEIDSRSGTSKRMVLLVVMVVIGVAIVALRRAYGSRELGSTFPAAGTPDA